MGEECRSIIRSDKEFVLHKERIDFSIKDIFIHEGFPLKYPCVVISKEMTTTGCMDKNHPGHRKCMWWEHAFFYSTDETMLKAVFDGGIKKDDHGILEWNKFWDDISHSMVMNQSSFRKNREVSEPIVIPSELSSREDIDRFDEEERDFILLHSKIDYTDIVLTASLLLQFLKKWDRTIYIKPICNWAWRICEVQHTKNERGIPDAHLLMEEIKKTFFLSHVKGIMEGGTAGSAESSGSDGPDTSKFAKFKT